MSHALPCVPLPLSENADSARPCHPQILWYFCTPPPLLLAVAIDDQSCGILGQSKPYPINLNTTSEQMQYLTTEMALKDFVLFANTFKWGDAAVSPQQAPWVVVGGSYPGMRAAFLRKLYPETVYAAYASSAPIQARKDMSICIPPPSPGPEVCLPAILDFEQVYRGMVKYGFKSCTERIKLAGANNSLSPSPDKVTDAHQKSITSTVNWTVPTRPVGSRCTTWGGPPTEAPTLDSPTCCLTRCTNGKARAWIPPSRAGAVTLALRNHRQRGSSGASFTLTGGRVGQISRC